MFQQETLGRRRWLLQCSNTYWTDRQSWESSRSRSHKTRWCESKSKVLRTLVVRIWTFTLLRFYNGVDVRFFDGQTHTHARTCVFVFVLWRPSPLFRKQMSVLWKRGTGSRSTSLYCSQCTWTTPIVVSSPWDFNSFGSRIQPWRPYRSLSPSL